MILVRLLPDVCPVADERASPPKVALSPFQRRDPAPSLILISQSGVGTGSTQVSSPHRSARRLLRIVPVGVRDAAMTWRQAGPAPVGELHWPAELVVQAPEVVTEPVTLKRQ